VEGSNVQASSSRFSELSRPPNSRITPPRSTMRLKSRAEGRGDPGGGSTRAHVHVLCHTEAQACDRAAHMRASTSDAGAQAHVHDGSCKARLQRRQSGKTCRSGFHKAAIERELIEEDSTVVHCIRQSWMKRTETRGALHGSTSRICTDTGQPSHQACFHRNVHSN
jgi:hypothetical protein